MPDTPKIALIIGPPGVGKGTHAALIESTFGLTPISTGDLLRKAVQSGSDIGKAAKAVMETGGLVSDELVADLLRDRLSRGDTGTGFLLDGYPRTLAQADALEEILSDLGLSVDIVLSLLVDEATVVERISGRFFCADCGAGYHDTFKKTAEPECCDDCKGSNFRRRADDTPDVIRKRLMEYNTQTLPLREHYRQSGHLHEIDASGSIETIATGIRACLTQTLFASEREQ